MAHRKRFTRGISDSQRRKKLWTPLLALPRDVEGAGDNTELTPTVVLGFPFKDAAGPGQSVATSIGVVYSLIAESTILRIRGSLNMGKNSVSTSDIETFAFAMGVMETGAALLGAFPNPATPEGSVWDGWMFYRSFNSAIVDAASTIVDVKAMRKVESGYSLVVVYGAFAVPFTTLDNAAINTSSAALTVRALLLLP